MNVIKLALGELQTNCYLLIKEDKVIIIDPGSEFNMIKNAVGDKEVLAVVLTHGHFDHINAVNDVINYYHCDFYVSSEDQRLIDNPSLSYQTSNFIKKAPILIENQTLEIDDFKFKVHKTPGHTKGSIILEIDHYLFTGDTLFKGSIGRTDFATGSNMEMQKSLKYILGFDNNFIVHPGHGESSTIEDEKLYNPYLRRIN